MSDSWWSGLTETTSNLIGDSWLAWSNPNQFNLRNRARTRADQTVRRVKLRAVELPKTTPSPTYTSEPPSLSLQQRRHLPNGYGYYSRVRRTPKVRSYQPRRKPWYQRWFHLWHRPPTFNNPFRWHPFGNEPKSERFLNRVVRRAPRLHYPSPRPPRVIHLRDWHG